MIKISKQDLLKSLCNFWKIDNLYDFYTDRSWKHVCDGKWTAKNNESNDEERTYKLEKCGYIAVSKYCTKGQYPNRATYQVIKKDRINREYKLRLKEIINDYQIEQDISKFLNIIFESELETFKIEAYEKNEELYKDLFALYLIYQNINNQNQNCQENYLKGYLLCYSKESLEAAAKKEVELNKSLTEQLEKKTNRIKSEVHYDYIDRLQFFIFDSNKLIAKLYPKEHLPDNFYKNSDKIKSYDFTKSTKTIQNVLEEQFRNHIDYIRKEEHNIGNYSDIGIFKNVSVQTMKNVLVFNSFHEDYRKKLLALFVATKTFIQNSGINTTKGKPLSFITHDNILLINIFNNLQDNENEDHSWIKDKEDLARQLEKIVKAFRDWEWGVKYEQYSESHDKDEEIQEENNSLERNNIIEQVINENNEINLLIGYVSIYINCFIEIAINNEQSLNQTQLARIFYKEQQNVSQSTINRSIHNKFTKKFVNKWKEANPVTQYSEIDDTEMIKMIKDIIDKDVKERANKDWSECRQIAQTKIWDYEEGIYKDILDPNSVIAFLNQKIQENIGEEHASLYQENGEPLEFIQQIFEID